MEVKHIKNKQNYEKLRKFFYETGVNVRPSATLNSQIKSVFINFQSQKLEKGRV